MSDSWRNILERAAENLAIELDQMAAPGFNRVQAASLDSGRLSTQLSFAESRELLARELQAFPAPAHTPRAAPRSEAPTTLTVPVMARIQEMEPARTRPKRSPWPNVFATVMSAVLTGGVTAYLLLAQGGIGKEDVLALAAYAGQSFRAAADESSRSASKVSVPGPAIVNKTNEDALMERASYQLKHGDGEGGRAVFEVLANHGSLRGTVALAETYDPAKLVHHAEWNLKSDTRLARAWYKKASELGSLPAYERLRDLERRSFSQL